MPAPRPCRFSPSPPVSMGRSNDLARLPSARSACSTCPPCARISWSIPTKCSKAGPRAPAACSPSCACCRAPSSRSSSTRRWSSTCSCCSRPSMSPTSSSPHALVATRLEHRDLLLVGVNSRDLATLQVVPGRLDRAGGTRCRSEVRRVAESGVATAGRRGSRRCRRIRPGTGGQCPHVRQRSGTRSPSAMLTEGRAAALARSPARAQR